GKGAAPSLSRGGRESGQIQLASNRCNQGHRGCKSSSGRRLISRCHAERISLGLTKAFQGDFHRDVVGQHPANHWSTVYCHFPVGRCHASHSRQLECRCLCCI